MPYRGAVATPPREASDQPRRLIFTIFGAFAREEGGWLSASHLVRLLGDLGVEEPAVRVALSRLKRRGLLDARAEDGAPGYGLTRESLQILAEGDRRIYGNPKTASSGAWVLIVFSVPEAERARRHQLRSELTNLGFGTVSPGIWIAPGHLSDEVLQMLKRTQLGPYVDVFAGSALGPSALKQSVGKWWDLPALQGTSEAFITGYQGILRKWRRNGSSDRDAFVDYVRALTAWRRLPYLDPGLPASVLPRDWKGFAAKALFDELRGELEAPARRHFLAAAQRARPSATRPTRQGGRRQS